MTLQEFEYWVADNYEELIGVANRVLKHSQAAEDLLHDFLNGIIEDPAKLPDSSVDDLLGWIGRALNRDVMDLRRNDETRRAAMERFGVSLEALGVDAYQDTARLKKVANNRRNQMKKSGGQALRRAQELEYAASQSVTIGHWLHGQIGDTRWRYQQIRDERLFDERAVRSLADSMHRASQRYRHDGEHGLSYTAFGQEPMQFGQEVAR